MDYDDIYVFTNAGVKDEGAECVSQEEVEEYVNNNIRRDNEKVHYYATNGITPTIDPAFPLR